MQPSPEPPDPPRLLAALRRRAAGRPAVSFAEFMAVALYDAEVGYYRRSAPRVGTGPGTDFYTASGSPLFGRLVVAACTALLDGDDPRRYTFVEIGAEPGPGVIGECPHPFASARSVRVGEPLELEGRCVAFSNELFDAQPFRRFRFGGAGWRELGVAVGGDALTEVELDDGPPAELPLPEGAAPGYVVDAPLAAADLARAIAAEPWEGLFLAFDYGKSWAELVHETPEGTARAYCRHQQSNDLLANPGGQDLTCHVCWDWIRDGLRAGGFAEPVLESQEAFWVHHAGAFIAEFTAAEAMRISRAKLSLLQLLHPAHMGQKFQALWAFRGKKHLA